MKKLRKKPKYSSLFKNMFINDAGIGSNRIIVSNNYLNNYNYFNKNNIKMLELRKKKYQENIIKLEEFKKEATPPDFSYTTSYYMYFNQPNNNYTHNDNNIKKLEINDFQDLSQNNDFENNTKKNHIRKTIKIYDDLITELNNKKNKTIHKTLTNNNSNNNINNNKKFSTTFNYISTNNNELSNDKKYDYTYNYRKKRFNMKCKVIFGKNLSSDYGKRMWGYKSEKKNKFKNYNKNKTIDRNNKNNYNKMKLEKNKVNPEYYKYIITNIYSDRNKFNNDLNKLSSSYGKEKMENNENDILIKDNNNNNDNDNNKVLPLIK